MKKSYALPIVLISLFTLIGCDGKKGNKSKDNSAYQNDSSSIYDPGISDSKEKDVKERVIDILSTEFAESKTDKDSSKEITYEVGYTNGSVTLKTTSKAIVSGAKVITNLSFPLGAFVDIKANCSFDNPNSPSSSFGFTYTANAKTRTEIESKNDGEIVSPEELKTDRNTLLMMETYIGESVSSTNKSISFIQEILAQAKYDISYSILQGE